MISKRLSQLQSEVEKYYDQLAGQEEAKRLAEDAQKVWIQQGIEVLPYLLC